MTTNKLTIDVSSESAVVILGEQLKETRCQLADTMRENERLREALEAIEGISNEDYKIGAFLAGGIHEDWPFQAFSDAKSIARNALGLNDNQNKHSENSIDDKIARCEAIMGKEGMKELGRIMIEEINRIYAPKTPETP